MLRWFSGRLVVVREGPIYGLKEGVPSTDPFSALAAIYQNTLLLKMNPNLI